MSRVKQRARILASVEADMRKGLFSGRCDERFAIKKDKSMHKVARRSAPDLQPAEGNEDEILSGRLARFITPAIKARADAEWAAMDSEGKLPKGWEYLP